VGFEVFCMGYNRLMSDRISMMDFKKIHQPYQDELDRAVLRVVHGGQYIQGAEVASLESELGSFMNSGIVTVGNGTDALQIALMALGVGVGDEVIVPAFTYAASAEVIGLLGATAVWADVDLGSFALNAGSLKELLTPKTKAIIVVHLFGQCADMESLLKVAGGIPIIEDNAQSFGAAWTSGQLKGRFAGTVGSIGTLSFFPTKVLGALGDGGAVLSSDSDLLQRMNRISKHGQGQKYHHEMIGVNSRLDPIQAAALKVKFLRVQESIERKQLLASLYRKELASIKSVILPELMDYCNHVYHQFTLRITQGKRELLRSKLDEAGIDSMVYYPIPLHQQKAYAHWIPRTTLINSELLCEEVISLPIHEAMSFEEVTRVCNVIKNTLSE
jgi:dTDP-4-amino-4,6-dideoxygalactose transaminase